MRQLRKKVVCLVEPGWEGIRRLTVSLAKEKVSSRCIIKGELGKDVLEMITKYNEISLKPVKRNVFKLYIFMMVLRNFFLQNTICVVMDNKKNYSWVSVLNKLLGIKTILLIENDHDYTLAGDQQPQNINFILNLAKSQR